MFLKVAIYVLFIGIISACSVEIQRKASPPKITITEFSHVINVDTSQKLDCDKILLNKIKVRNSLLKYCKQQLRRKEIVN